MAPRGTYKRQLSPYPGFLFHVIRTAQLLAAVVVSADVVYFSLHLMHGRYKLPWMFYFLQGAASLTILTIAVTSILYCCHRLHALYNAIVNIILFIIWSVGFSLLTNNMRGTLLRQCTIHMWGDSTGVRVCQLYKIMFSLSALGVASTLAAFILDIVVHRRAASRGKYVAAPKGNTLLHAHGETAYMSSSQENLYDEFKVPSITMRSPSPGGSHSRGPSPVRGRGRSPSPGFPNAYATRKSDVGA